MAKSLNSTASKSKETKTPPKAKVTPKSAKPQTTRHAAINEDRETMIRNAAYYLAESDGFQPGREEEYWVQAEAQVEQLLSTRGSPSLEEKH